MFLVNLMTFVVLKILQNLLNKTLEMKITAVVSKILETVQRIITFVLNVLLESGIDLPSFQ